MTCNRLFVTLLFFFACSLHLAAQPPLVQKTLNQAEAVDEETSTKSRAAELYMGFEETAASLDLKTAANGEAFKFDPQPLLRFASEGTVFGTVHVWKDASSRLAVIGTIGSIPISNRDYEFVELHLLRPERIEPISITGQPTKSWNPEVETLKFLNLTKSPPVASSDRRRLVQMRGIARQFSAEMTHKGSVNQLRLLPEPLFRYGDSTPETDGALFAFVWDTGTDPELLLRIETIETPKGLIWHYQSVRFTYRALELKHNSIKVWAVDEFLQRDAPQQNTPYLTGLTKPID